MKVSYYKTAIYKKGSGDEKATDLYLEDVLDGIKTGKWKKEQDRWKAAGGLREQKAFLPNFMPSGTFKTPTNEGVLTTTGLIGIDFDHVDSLEATYQILLNDPYVRHFFKSVSGGGYCALVNIEPKRFSEAYLGLEKYFLDTYGLITDSQCKNIARRRFLSYDPDAEIQALSEKVFKDYIVKPKGRPAKQKPLSNIHTDGDIEHVINQIESRSINLTSGYDEWYKIGFAILSKYGDTPQGLDYFQRISQFHEEYDAGKTAQKYRQLAQSASGKVGIGTLYYHAKQAGIEPYTERTKYIASVASIQKRAGVTSDSVVASLEKMENIPAKESKEIVEAVFETDAELDEEQGVVEKIELYLRRNHPMRFNTVEIQTEFLDGKPVTDRHINGIYISLKKALGKEVNKGDIDAIIESPLVPEYNPILDFFEQNKHRQPVGNIEKLASSITPSLNEFVKREFPQYVQYFLKRWLVGIVASAHGEYSPLMLVLTGGQNTGKTEFFRRLFPNELRRYFDDSKQANAKDEEILLCKKLLILDDEFSGKNKQEIRRFKELSSKQTVTQRLTYGRRHQSFERIAVFCGTCNDTNVLNDPTGNRRIIPVEVVRINHDLYNNIDKTDLLIEAYHAWKAGYSHHLNQEEVKYLNESTHEFEEHELERELILQFFSPITKGASGFPERLTATQIKVHIERDTNQRTSLRKIGQYLKSLEFQCKQERINGQSGQYYTVYRV